jgi:hypothetical protein
VNLTRQSIRNEPPLRIGEVIDRRYVVEAFLGEDDHSVLASARHNKLGSVEVVVKVLRPEIANADPRLLQRFIDQVRVAAGIQSKHMTKVMNVGALPNGGAFALMERHHGYHLGRVLAAGASIPGQDAIKHVLAACRALAPAHELGHCHGNLRPSSLFWALSADGPPTTKLLGMVDTLRPAHASRGGDIQALGAILEAFQAGSPSIIKRCRSGGFADVSELQSALMALLTEISA